MPPPLLFSPFPAWPPLLRALDWAFLPTLSQDADVPAALRTGGASNSSSSGKAYGLAYDVLRLSPTPAYPFEEGTLLARIFPPSFYAASLRATYPLLFAAAYYALAQLFNAGLRRRRRRRRRGAASEKQGAGTHDYIASSSVLRTLVLAHNAGLALFSAWIWIHLFPAAVDYYWQGISGAGWQGALASSLNLARQDELTRSLCPATRIQATRPRCAPSPSSATTSRGTTTSFT